MAQFGYKLLLFVAIVIVAVGGSSACPKSCNCTETTANDKQGIIVDCKGKRLSTIPSELPQNTTTL